MPIQLHRTAQRSIERPRFPSSQAAHFGNGDSFHFAFHADSFELVQAGSSMEAAIGRGKREIGQIDFVWSEIGVRTNRDVLDRDALVNVSPGSVR